MPATCLPSIKSSNLYLLLYLLFFTDDRQVWQKCTSLCYTVAMQTTCKQCATQFTVTDLEKTLRNKLESAIEVDGFLDPDYCIDCRVQRRFAWRNERHLYFRECDLTGKKVMSVFHPDADIKVYHQTVFNGDDWDQHASALDYDSSKPFFEQFAALIPRAPLPSHMSVNSDNCEYTNLTMNNKDCYMVFGTHNSQDCYYGNYFLDTNSSMDCYWSTKCELMYESVYCEKSYGCNYLQLSKNCRDCFFGYDLIDCTNCFGCINLRHQEHYILNEPATEQEVAALRSSLSNLTKLKEFQQKYEALKQQQVHRYAQIENSQDCSGDNITNSQNCVNAFLTDKDQDLMHSFITADSKDMLDVTSAGWSELIYNTVACGYSTHSACCYTVIESHYCLYSNNVFNCKHCFGCSGLRRAEYCILNKQYTKEQYEQLVPKIIERMKADGEWGQFYPPAMSPFAYNESVACEYYPLTKAEVLERGWKWRDKEDSLGDVTKTIPADQLPDSIDGIPDDILNWAIECETSGRPFKIMKQELEFYRARHLPIPHLHPDERHARRMSLRNPRTLWNRQCAKCSKDVQTTFAPERPETIYCNECYLAEVY